MARLPKRNQELTEQGGQRRCWICGELIGSEDEDWVWHEGRPAHEGCAWDEAGYLKHVNIEIVKKGVT